ncbi:BMP family ABC transporter substrate-binding protein [Roseomonas sp. AR75]|uniref:BMP family ABC transporter substrate-binding protein n=1 Tax=Roseomonas sp. AR75 TaxID=2562311 RepID=UPI001F10AF22|nr:BMP family ABC transporter substrate-binding protein [Roseomonas sp. AR75]
MMLTRRHLLGAAGTAALVPAAQAQAPKPNIGFILVGPVGDFGWSYQHDQGRQAMMRAVGEDRISSTVVESVAPPDFDRVVTQLSRNGARLIFTTSFTYFQPTLRAAQRMGNIRFESCTGTAPRAPNVAVYDGRFYEGRYIQGVVAARKSKTKQIGYVAAFPIPEVIHGINTLMRGAWSVDPAMKVRVVWANTWFDPPKEADAARALIDQGCDVLCQHTDSPAPLQLAEQRGIFGFGQASDMTRFAPRAHLFSSIDDWNDYYIARARALLDNTWQPTDTWEGLAGGMLRLPAFTNMTPEEAAEAERIVAGIKSGAIKPFAGPIVKQDGTEVIPAGQVLTDAQIKSMNFFYRGIDATIPG